MKISSGPGELIAFTQTEDINDDGISYCRHTPHPIENETGENPKGSLQPCRPHRSDPNISPKARKSDFGMAA